MFSIDSSEVSLRLIVCISVAVAVGLIVYISAAVDFGLVFWVFKSDIESSGAHNAYQETLGDKVDPAAKHEVPNEATCLILE